MLVTRKLHNLLRDCVSFCSAAEMSNNSREHSPLPQQGDNAGGYAFQCRGILK